jgi:hypothetical protein
VTTYINYIPNKPKRKNKEHGLLLAYLNTVFQKLNNYNSKCTPCPNLEVEKYVPIFIYFSHTKNISNPRS